eukprot:TRINITY_DN16838_c0_g3_i1.p1 TRINITY_DN16838_c0_g3~~TRINITY_DN16838_c0_g3_i1.p1  ORF type:complete len:2020 (-),score=638.02 TRINITY_DN16838_c0_g3_i1:82-6141(-)
MSWAASGVQGRAAWWQQQAGAPAAYQNWNSAGYNGAAASSGQGNIVQPPSSRGSIVKLEAGVAPTPSAASAVGVGAAAGGYTVFSSGRENDEHEVVVRTLVGDYQEHSANHNRKVYVKKSTDSGHPDAVDVYMYYWDNRDGPAFEGWWFGNQIGGTQVWSHNPSSSTSPPPSGWRIPWDGKPRASLCVASQADRQRQQAEAQMKNVAGPANEVIATARAALQRSKDALAAGNALGLRTVEQELATVQPRVTQALQAVQSAQAQQRGTSNPQLLQLGANLRSLQQTINLEQNKVRSAAAKAETETRDREAREQELASFAVALQEVTYKTNMAEDTAEKAVITAEMIEGAGDDVEEAKHAVAATEQAVAEAQKRINDARLAITQRNVDMRRMTSAAAKQEAAQQTAALQKQLQEASKKLEPLKNCRASLDQRLAAKKLAGEVLQRLSNAELEVDQAEEAAMLLTASDGSKDLLMKAEAAAKKATDRITSVAAFITMKKKTTSGAAAQELQKLEDRCKQSTERLNELRNATREVSQRTVMQGILEEAEGRLRSVVAALGKVADAEGPFLMGVEDLPLKESSAALKACENAVGAASTQYSTCKTFLATKLVEAKRMPEKLSKECSEKLRAFQVQLEGHNKKLVELKGVTATRRRKSRLREAEGEAEKALDLCRALDAAVKALEDDAELSKMSASEVRAAADAASKAHAAATSGLSKAREFITARQLELKAAKDASTEDSAKLIRLQTKLSSAQTEVAKQQGAAVSTEQRLAQKRLVDAALKMITNCEEKAAKVEALIEEEKGDAFGAAASSSSSAPASASDAAAAEGESPSAAAKATAKAAPKAKAKGKGKGKEKGAETVDQALAMANQALTQATRYVENQAKNQKSGSNIMAKVAPQLEKAKARIEALSEKLREKRDRAVMNDILTEVKEKVATSDEATQKAVKLEAQLKDTVAGAEEGADTAESVVLGLSELEAAVQLAGSASNVAKTALAMKKLAAKRLAEGLRMSIMADLDQMQEKHDKTLASLKELREAVTSQKLATAKLEVAGTLGRLETLVAKATDLSNRLSEAKPEDDVAELSVQAEAAQQEAAKGITNGKVVFAKRQREAKASMTPDPAIQADIMKAIERSTKMQQEVEKLKALTRDTSRKAASARICFVSNAAVEKVEAELKTQMEAAAPFLEEDFSSALALKRVVGVLAKHRADAKLESKELFKKVAGGGSSIAEEKFVEYVKALPGASTVDEAGLKGAYKAMEGGKDGAVSEESFLANFTELYACVSPATISEEVSVRSGKLLRKVEVGEVLHGLEEPALDEECGLKRVKVRAEKDGKVGYITIAGNQGTRYLETRTVKDSRGEELDRRFAALEASCRETSKTIDQSIMELNKLPGGPVPEKKTELMKLKSRLGKAQMETTKTKKKLQDSVKRRAESLEAEQKRVHEAAEREEVTKEVQQMTSDVEAYKTDAEKALALATAAAEKGAAASAIEEAVAALKESQAVAEREVAKLKAQQESIKGGVKGPRLDIRVSATKLRGQVTTLEVKVKKQLSALQAARAAAADEAHRAVAGALRAYASRRGTQQQNLFKELAGRAEQVSVETLRKTLEKAPEAPSGVQLDLALERYAAHGLSRLAFVNMLQEYMKCVKEIALTDNFEVNGAKTTRKLAVGELVEVLEAPRNEPSTGLSRARCRVLSEGMEGWITLRGNAGTNFLESCSKPFCCSYEALPLEAAFESGGAEVRKMKCGEVLEVLEGPRNEPSVDVLRLRCKAKKDGKAGWATVSDSLGTILEATKVMMCSQSIALTTHFDIAEAKPIRKVEAGEVLEQLEGYRQDEARSLKRVRVKAAQDGKEGWITAQGSHGTAYVEVSEKLYVCRRATPLELRLASGGTCIRQLEVGEVVDALGGTQVETRLGSRRLKVRNMAGGADAQALWFTPTAAGVKPWQPRYKCVQVVAMSEGFSSSSGLRRKVEPGEHLVALDAPTEEPGTGLLRANCRAEKDGLVGFVTVRGNQGTAMLEPVPCTAWSVSA